MPFSRGGGGNRKQRRGFADVRRLIAPIFAVFFAAGFVNSANAQDAQMSVFLRTTGNIAVNPAATPSMVNFAQNLRPFLADVEANYGNSHFVIHLVNDDGTTTFGGMAHSSGLIEYNGRLMAAGDVIGLPLDFTAAFPPSTVRLYNISSSSLAMATVVADSPKAALGANEFYLNSVTWEATTIRATTNFGFVPLQDSDCGTLGAMADGLSCNMPAAVNPPGNGGGTPDNVGDAQTLPSDGESISDGGRSHAPALVFGGLMLVGAIGAVASGDLSAFSFAPDFGYAINESGYSYNYGTRLDFAKENWRLYWTAGQTNRNGDFGDFSYASGGEYRSDSELWNATFSESVSGEIANYNFALSADYDFVSSETFGGGIWNLSPTYRFNSVLDWKESESESRNSLNIESVVRMNRWTIRPTAGFNWRRLDEFGDSAKFGISAVHRF